MGFGSSRRAFAGVVLRSLAGLALASAASCGGTLPGFRIDNVSITPADIPVGTQSTELLRLSADVIDDNHEVLSAWASFEEAPITLDLGRGTDPRWSGSIQVRSLGGLAVGTYRIDLHAQDDAGRSIVLTDAVRLQVTFE